jgi:hypothetical protein
MNRPPKPAVILELADEPRPGQWPAVPFPVRLRAALKVMLRAYGLRCRKCCDGSKAEIKLKDEMP